MKKFKLVDLDNGTTICKGYAESLQHFKSISSGHYNEYNKECQMVADIQRIY